MINNDSSNLVTDERLNAATHMLGAVVAAIAGGWLVACSCEMNSTAVTCACTIYVVTLIGLYCASSLSHCFEDEHRRSLYRSLDQACIYLLIVGTYTPFSIAHLNSWWWNLVLAVMWTLAITGFISKLFFAHRIERVSIWLYVLLGWIPALAGMPFNREVPGPCMTLVVAGGIVYTAGTYFLFNDHRTTYFHAIWHTFVLAASAIHFYAVVNWVVF